MIFFIRGIGAEIHIIFCEDKLKRPALLAAADHVAPEQPRTVVRRRPERAVVHIALLLLEHVDLRAEGRIYLRPHTAAPPAGPDAGRGAAPPARQEVR